MVHKVFIYFKEVLFKGHYVDNYEGDYPPLFNLNKFHIIQKNQT